MREGSERKKQITERHILLTKIQQNTCELPRDRASLITGLRL